MKKILFALFFILLAVRVMAADEWLKTRPASTDTRISWPSSSQANNAAIDRVLANYREGMTLTYSSGSTISIPAGEVVCSNAAGTVRKFRQNTSATNVTFTDIDTGSEASGTQYYLYAVCDADATTATFKISASSTAPTGVTYYKRLGSFYNDSGSNISRISLNNATFEVGAISSKTAGTAYQALTDGFVNAYIYNSEGTEDGSIYGQISDDNSSWTTIAYDANDNGPDATVAYASISFPVRKGNYYKVTGVSTSSTTVYFTPLN